MIKYILGLIIVFAIVLVAITIGANNDQVITLIILLPKVNYNFQHWLQFYLALD